MTPDATERLLAVISGGWAGSHALAVLLTAVVVPCLMWVVGFRFQWRKDGREQAESVMALTVKLIEEQRAELSRQLAAAETLRRQLDLLGEGRWRLQDALNTLRDQTIAARAMVHQYQRQLGLPDTEFPPIPLPTLILENP